MAELIVALDCEKDKAKWLVDLLSKKVRIFKIGPVLFIKEGPKIIEWMNSKGVSVFLDLKLHDIPNTVRSAIKGLKDLNIYSLTVHISGGPTMLKAAVEGSEGKIKIWGVSILTSIDKYEYSKISFRYSLEKQVLHFSKIAKDIGIDGIVVSPRELTYISNFIKGINFITPSIRFDTIENDDQKRYMSPKDAVRYGANYIVVGRPIIESKDPYEVVERIYKEMK